MPASLAPSPGGYIKELREKAGLTQDQLASMAGVSQPLVSSIEKGRRRVTLTMAVKLERALGLDPYTIVKVVDSAGDSPGSLIPWPVSSTHPFVQRVSAHLTVAA